MKMVLLIILFMLNSVIYSIFNTTESIIEVKCTLFVQIMNLIIVDTHVGYYVLQIYLQILSILPVNVRCATVVVVLTNCIHLQI